MLNCYRPRKVPPESSGHNGAKKKRENEGDAKNGERGGVDPPEAASDTRADGRGPYDLRQVRLQLPRVY